MIILTSILVLGILGFVFAALLALAADYFKIEEDPRITSVMAILPGRNCGVCGEAGCGVFAEKLIKGKVAVTGCLAGGASVAKKLAEVMGVEQPTDVHKYIVVLHCGAKETQRKTKASYSGVKTCRAANLVDGGGLLCSYGCLGYGDCSGVCPFDALTMKDGLPKVDPSKCTSCGKCVAECPRRIMAIIPYDFGVYIACSSQDRGAETRKICPVGCIACKICEKEVPEVFKVADNLAVMDYSKNSMNCESAMAKCPTKCIVKL
jgi:RnfABCDGE-type electron transport complex B subunit